MQAPTSSLSVSTPDTFPTGGSIGAKKDTINESGIHYEAPPLQSTLLRLLDTAIALVETKEVGGYHHAMIIGKVSDQHVDVDWLRSAGYKFSKGSGKSNLSHFHRIYRFPGIAISHMVHLNGTWVMQVTPKLVQTDPERMMSHCRQVLTSAFTGANSFHVVVRKMEKSAADTQEVVEWLKARNVKEFKVYLHDNYEARVEVTYLDPAFSPKTSALLAYLG